MAWGRPVLGVPDSGIMHEFRMQAREHYVHNLLKATTRNLCGARLRRTITPAAHAVGAAELIADFADSRRSLECVERYLAGSAPCGTIE